MSIIESITQELTNRGIMQKDFCAKLGISTSTFSTWKARNAVPSSKFLKSICDFFGWSYDDVIEKCGDPNLQIHSSAIREFPKPKMNSSTKTELGAATEELISVYNSLSLSSKAKVMSFVAELKESESE